MTNKDYLKVIGVLGLVAATSIPTDKIIKKIKNNKKNRIEQTIVEDLKEENKIEEDPDAVARELQKKLLRMKRESAIRCTMDEYGNLKYYY